MFAKLPSGSSTGGGAWDDNERAMGTARTEVLWRAGNGRSCGDGRALTSFEVEAVYACRGPVWSWHRRPDGSCPLEGNARADDFAGHTSPYCRAGGGQIRMNSRMRGQQAVVKCGRSASAWLLACVVTCQLHAQSSALMRGVVSAEGSAVPNAPIQAKNTQTGATFRSISLGNGQYELPGLPPGSYDVSVRMPGFQYAPFRREGVTVTSGQALSLDVELANSNLNTIADDPFTYLSHIRAEAVPLTGPVPRAADGRPDLSGIWFGNDDLFPDDPELLPWAAERVQAVLANDLKDIPGARCLPMGILQNGPFFRKFVQTPSLVVILNEDNPLGFRQVFLDGRVHPLELNPTWQGHAIGRWEGDTLVVDVTGFNDRSVMGIAPHTPQLRITERYRRRDFGHLEVQVTADDPGTLVKPWIINMVWDLAPKQELLEFLCHENIRNLHLEWDDKTKMP